MIDILIETNFYNNKRIFNLIEGIKKVSVKRKENISLYFDCEKITEKNKHVIVLGASKSWIEHVTQILQQKCANLVIFGHQPQNAIKPYNCVVQSYEKTMYLLTKMLLEKGKDSVAFFGYNKDSLPDILKLRGFLKAIEESEVENYKIFENDGNIDKLVKDFCIVSENYKNVVCVNDSLAVLLLQKLQNPENYNISGMGGMLITKYMSYPLLTARLDYFKSGIAIAELYNSMRKSELLNNMVLTLDMQIIYNNEVVDDIENKPIILKQSEKSINFFSNDDVLEIDNVELMLANMDEIDWSILKDLMGGLSYEAISEKYFMAHNTVKYRIRKLKSYVGCQSKTELVEILKKYDIKG